MALGVAQPHLQPEHPRARTGMQGMDQGMGLDVVPSLAVGQQKRFVAAATRPTTRDTNPSLDVFYRFTPSLNGALTINTDFSATEVDDRQVNLTRFNLFFPEKRDFFLNDADLFEFGRISGSGSNESNEATSRPSRENARPFFSRRIGLSATGTPVDIEYGGKFSGRVGRWSSARSRCSQDEFGSKATGLRRSAGLVRRARLGERARRVERRHRHDRRRSAGEHRQLASSARTSAS